jgi:hypothetical protein
MHKNKKIAFCLGILATALVAAQGSWAAVSADEAAKLNTTLTPLGAERAGNADNSIPKWEGGYTKVDPSFKNGGKRSDPFSGEKALFSINAQNMAQYADKLTEGTKAMLKKYPDSYRLDVYPTHRTAAAPQWVYDNTLKNAATTKLVQGSAGSVPEGAHGGVPFPLPQNGEEAMWNHLLRWRGTAFHLSFTQYLGTADGKRVLTGDARGDFQMPYYQQGKTPEQTKGVYWSLRLLTDGPPLRAGEAITGLENMDANNTAIWTYMPGQRRVRKLPNACCDTPQPTTSGVMSFDDMYVYTGRMDRFDWKLVGKKEVYIPYNSNKVFTANKPEDTLAEHHLNPDVIRWELHRVWVVEANLKPGKRNLMAKSTYYLDEDTWAAVLADRYDGKGQLAKMLWGSPVVLPDLPGVVVVNHGFYDLTSGAWYAAEVHAGKAEQYRIMDTYSDSVFSPDAMAGESVR